MYVYNRGSGGTSGLGKSRGGFFFQGVGRIRGGMTDLSGFMYIELRVIINIYIHLGLILYRWAFNYYDLT